MLFRPSYCCNCGEPIQRTDWRLWTSRRFCDLCATDFTLFETLSKLIVVFAGVICVLGLVNYFAGGTRKSDLAAARALERQPVQKLVEDPSRLNSPAQAQQTAPVDNRQLAPAAALSAEPPAARPLLSSPSTSQAAKPLAETAAPAYFCGAETRKGTPCSRRVKGNVRCWQHTGMPAMLPPDKLLVSR